MKRTEILMGLIGFISIFSIGLAANAQIVVTPSSNDLTIVEEDTFGPETITVTVPADSGATNVDVYFMADTTGSMGSVINAVKAGGAQVVDDLLAALPGVDLRFGVGNYKDFPFDPFAFDHQLSITADAVAVKAEINNWIASGGFDGSEGQFYALDRIGSDADPAGGTIGWRTGAEKIVVWFGDAPGHDPVCTAISGLGIDITEASVTTLLTDGGYSVLAISTVTGFPAALDDDPTLSAVDYAEFCAINGTPGQSTRIANATGGEAVAGIAAGDIVAKIVELVEGTVNTINKLELVPTASIAGLVQSIEPPSYTDVSTDVEQNLPFDVTFTCPLGSLGVFEGSLQVLVDGSNEAEKTVRIECLPKNTPPIAECVEGANPSGKNVPPAGSTTLPGSKGGQNEDGFYEIIGTDAEDETVDVFVTNASGSATFGPFTPGSVVKITEAPGATPSSKTMGGPNSAVVAHIKLDSDAFVFAVDSFGEVSPLVSCLVPPPPK